MRYPYMADGSAQDARSAALAPTRTNAHMHAHTSTNTRIRHHWFRAAAAAVCACLLAGAPMSVPAAFATDDSPASDGSSTFSDISPSGSAPESSADPVIADDLPSASVAQAKDPQCMPQRTSSDDQGVRLLFSPDGATVYTIPYPDGNAICRIDVASMTVTGKADLTGVDLYPAYSADISDDGSHIVLGADDNGQGDSGLSVNTADMSLTRLPVESMWFAPSPDGSIAYAYTRPDPSLRQQRRIVSISTADGTIIDDKIINLPFAATGYGADLIEGVSPDCMTWYVDTVPQGSSTASLVAVNAQTGTSTTLPVVPTHDDASPAAEDYLALVEPRDNGDYRGFYASMLASSDTVYFTDATLNDAPSPSPLVALNLRTGALSAVNDLQGLSLRHGPMLSADGSVMYGYDTAPDDGGTASVTGSSTSGLSQETILSTSDWSVKGTVPWMTSAQYKGEKMRAVGGTLTRDGSTVIEPLGVYDETIWDETAPTVLRMMSTDGAYVANYAVDIPNAERARKNLEGSSPIIASIPTPDGTGVFVSGAGLPLTKVTVPADWKQQAAAASQAASDAAASGEADDAKDAAPDASRGRRVAWGVGVAVAVVAVLAGVAVASRRRGGKRRRH